MAKHGKVKEYAKQHFVPQCYTKSWCDPSAPAGPKNTPYVWQFDSDGTNTRRKAPTKLFTENDIYTIEAADGERDLRLEHGFQGLEDKFTRIRNLRFGRGEWPDDEQMAFLLAFVATAHPRTAAFRNFHRDQWANIRMRAETMEADMRRATPAQHESMRRMSKLTATNDRSMSIDDVRRLEQQPIHSLLAPTLRAVLPIYAQMHVAVLCTDDPLGFITTDDPVTWCDPEAYKLQPIWRSPGLAVRTIEVTLPISPRQCLLISHNANYAGYIDIDERTVNELNRRHIAHCNESFIARSNEIRSVWFENRPMPDDAWEKVRERKIASGEWS
jgi:hypothetical protein